MKIKDQNYYLMEYSSKNPKGSSSLTIKDNKIVNLITIIQLVKSPLSLQLDNPAYFIVHNKVLQHHAGQQNDLSKKGKRKIKIKKVSINQNIAKTIVLCSFINLQQLTINDAQIDNLQFVAFLNAPKLRHLLLAGNKITNFRSFTKLSIPKIELINIMENYANQIMWERMKLGQKITSLSFVYCQEKENRLEDLSKLAKLQPMFVNIINVLNPKRIMQYRVAERIREKFCYRNQNNFLNHASLIDDYISDHW